MSDSTPMPADHPCMKAWETYKADPEGFGNDFRWVTHDEECRAGALWSAFNRGWMAAESERDALKSRMVDLEELTNCPVCAGRGGGGYDDDWDECPSCNGDGKINQEHLRQCVIDSDSLDDVSIVLWSACWGNEQAGDNTNEVGLAKLLAADRDALRARVAELEKAVSKAADRFDRYANIHAKKRTMEGDAKSAENRVMAESMRRALIAPKPETESEPDE